jgi:haloalkane dehalogenase
MPSVDVLDSFIHYRDTDPDASGAPVVFLHGNPTSSYLWRNVIPHVAPLARVLAPDLIGMGGSGQPDLAYDFADHARYLDAWFDALNVDCAVLVGHDWGGALAMDLGARRPERVQGVAVLETFLRPMRWAEMPEPAVKLFSGYRSPEGENMVLRDNMFIEVNLPRSVAGLAPDDLDVYRAPYPTPESRRPMLAWARQFPLDGEPADVVARVERYGRWMADSADTPKLLMAVNGGVGLGSPDIIEWAAQTFASAEVADIGPGGHQTPEDQPHAIGSAVAQWLDRHGLVSARAA